MPTSLTGITLRLLLQDEQDNRTVFGPILQLGPYHFVGDLPSVEMQREVGFSDRADRVQWTRRECPGPGAPGFANS